MACLLLKYTF